MPRLPKLYLLPFTQLLPVSIVLAILSLQIGLYPAPFLPHRCLFYATLQHALPRFPLVICILWFQKFTDHFGMLPFLPRPTNSGTSRSAPITAPFRQDSFDIGPRGASFTSLGCLHLRHLVSDCCKWTSCGVGYLYGFLVSSLVLPINGDLLRPLFTLAGTSFWSPASFFTPFGPHYFGGILFGHVEPRDFSLDALLHSLCAWHLLQMVRSPTSG